MPRASKKQKVDHDKELFSALSEDRIILTEEQIQNARNQDEKALYKIGVKYMTRLHYTKALAWFRKAAGQNHSPAQNYIGVMYRYGHGVPCNYKEAMSWFVRAVNNDENREAQHNIGMLYEGGYDVPKNIHTTIDWYTKSANQGYVKAQADLGWIYKKNDKVKDLQKAVNWFKMAADNGYEYIYTEVKLLNDQGYYAGGEYEDKYDDEYNGDYEGEGEVRATLKTKVEVNTKDEPPQIIEVLDSSSDSEDDISDMKNDIFNKNNQQKELLSPSQSIDSNKYGEETNNKTDENIKEKEQAHSVDQNKNNPFPWLEDLNNKIDGTFGVESKRFKKEKMKEMEENFRLEIQRVKQEKTEMEEMLQGKVSSLEKDKAQMEDKIKQLKVALDQSTQMFEENPSIVNFYH